MTEGSCGRALAKALERMVLTHWNDVRDRTPMLFRWPTAPAQAPTTSFAVEYPMLKYLRDYANAITATGFVFAILGLFLALNGHMELGTASMLWMWFLDHWDGHVARKTSNSRRPGAAAFGKCFDGFGDFIHGVIFPSVVVVLVGEGGVLSLVAILALIMAGAIRLSYFESFGLTSDAKFTGIPVSYDTPLVAILLIARPSFPVAAFPTVVAMAFIALAVLHVTSAVKVPAIRGRAIPIATIAAIIVSATLILDSVK